MRKTLSLGLLAVATSLALVVPLAPAGAAEPENTRERRGDGAGIARHSLRAGLTDHSFYFVMGDRFENGDPSNDEGGLSGDKNTTGFDPTGKGYYNGGDLEGLASRLDYIQGLGTKAIWLTPVFKNKPVQMEDGPSAGYHGYWITDFTQVDPHLGTNEDLAALVDAAHARGMKVFFDIITNHTADVIGYEEGDRTAYVSKDQVPYRTAGGAPFDDRDYAGGSGFPTLDPSVSFPYTPWLEPEEEDVKSPAWLNDVTLYHNRGNTTFTGEDSQYGDFFGLDDLFTEHPTVVNGMERIYKTWIRDFGIDGFRIDTMKHVDDAFWKSFGPGVLRYAQRNGKPDFFMFGEVYDDRTTDAGAAFRSHYSTHARMQSVLDFGFQMAARNYVSKGGSARDLSGFFTGDDWYTDADSNAYELPTFLGNHDMGRFGYFLTTDNPGADDAELLARDRLAHELMYFSRGNPVVFYGDEQGFTGTGGDQLARQSMFASDVPEYQDDDSIGTDATPAQDSFDADHPLYRAISRLAELTERRPALRDGAMQVRHGSAGPGVFAFSRVDREKRREYLVVLNNSESARSARVRTYLPRGGELRRIYGTGPATLTTGRGGRADVTAEPLSSAVYVSKGRIPRSGRAPGIDLRSPRPAEASRGRMLVQADVSGHQFAEVTFQARVADGRWRTVGTDDNAPYRVFHDVSGREPGTPVRYRAVVLDNAGHTRMSEVRGRRVPSPSVTVTAPADGGTVTSIDPVTVTAAVDPERPTMRVRFERSVSGGAWQRLGTDWSSPAYTVTDDVSDLDLGTEVRYRAILLEPGSPRVTSRPVEVTTAKPQPAYEHVTVAGNLQTEMGCTADWDPACADSRLTFDDSDGQWHGTWTLPEGTYEWKIAVEDSWDENYGAGGAAGGSNLTLEVPPGGDAYRFTWNQVTKVPSVEEAP